MKRNYLTILILLVAMSSVKAQNFKWAKSMGDYSEDEGHGITIDAAGNVITVGYFSGTVDFDPGSGIFTMTSANSYDIFVSKLDANGNFLWAKQVGNNYNEQATDVTIDKKGNIILTGAFTGVVDFDPNGGTYNLSGSLARDAYVLKLSSSGSFLWAKRLATGGGLAQSIALDAAENIYSTGYFIGTCDFNPGSGVYNLVSPGGSMPEVYVSKLDSGGNFVWARRMGGTKTDIGYSIALDAAANIYTLGRFEGTGDFDPGSGFYNLTAFGNDDAFVSKLDSSGNFIWAVQQGGSASWTLGYSIAVDGLGNAYTTGGFNGTVDFDPGTSIYNISSINGSSDIFLSKLRANGKFAWAFSIGANLSDDGYKIKLDPSANIFTTGGSSGNVDFDPGSGSSTLIGKGGVDVYVAKYDSTGSYLWAVNMGQINMDMGQSIDLDAAKNVYVTGFFDGVVDFDPGSGVTNLTSVGKQDIFVLKLGNLGTSQLEQHNEQDIMLYPNPFESEFSIQIPGEVNSRFELFNLQGQLLRSTQIIGDQFTFQRNNLPPGMYIYKISSNEGLNYQGKLIAR